MTEQSAPPTPDATTRAAGKRSRDFQEKVQELRMQSIREALGRVVARHGLAGATMAAIAAEAGIAKGTLYLYFESREKLIEKTADHALEGLNRQVAAALAEPVGFDAQLASLIHAVLGFFDANSAFFRLTLAVGEGGRRRGFERTVHPRFEEYLAHLETWLDGARERGEVRDFPAGMPVAAIAGAIGGVLRRRFEAGADDTPLADEAARLTELLFHGLGRSSPGDRR